MRQLTSSNASLEMENILVRGGDWMPGSNTLCRKLRPIQPPATFMKNDVDHDLYIKKGISLSVKLLARNAK